jgi:hypothetical protein
MCLADLIEIIAEASHIGINPILVYGGFSKKWKLKLLFCFQK